MTEHKPDRRGKRLLLGEKVSRMVENLARSSFAPASLEPEETGKLTYGVSEETVTRVVEAWRKRTSYLPAELLSDPAWGMLLELMQAEVQDRRVSLSRLCKVSRVPDSTAVRWLKALERQGLVIRRSESKRPEDEFVELSIKGSSALRRYFHDVEQMETAGKARPFQA